MIRPFALIILMIPVILSSALISAKTHPLATEKNPSADNTGSAVRIEPINLFSWNVSGNAFVKNPELFKALISEAQATIIVLDEVSEKSNETEIRQALPRFQQNHTDDWQISFGQSGGRQRTVVASRYPIEVLPELSNPVSYPNAEKIRLKQRMIAAGNEKYSRTLEQGIAVNGVIITIQDKRLLVISIDLECCGNDPASWEEEKRRVEAGVIRELVRSITRRSQVDGIIVAGDLNLVSTVMPLILISGPYEKPHHGLIAADLKHIDGQQTWTWDGKGTPFPSRVLDLVIYSPNSLNLVDGYIFDPKDIAPDEQKRLGLVIENFTKLSEHLPLFTKFKWHE